MQSQDQRAFASAWHQATEQCLRRHALISVTGHQQAHTQNQPLNNTKKDHNSMCRLLYVILMLAVSFNSGDLFAADTPTASTKGGYTNHLGMRFAYLKGTNILMSIWQVKVSDYEAFIKATGRSWDREQPDEDPNLPAVFVNYHDAIDFCAWLTEVETKTGLLRAGEYYRLPLDREWSLAVGIHKEPGDTPLERADISVVGYPW